MQKQNNKNNEIVLSDQWVFDMHVCHFPHFAVFLQKLTLYDLLYLAIQRSSSHRISFRVISTSLIDKRKRLLFLPILRYR